MPRPKLPEDQKSKTITIKDTPENKEDFKRICQNYGMGKTVRQYLKILYEQHGIT